jgi:hypothetical protein
VNSRGKPSCLLIEDYDSMVDPIQQPFEIFVHMEL